MAAPYQWSFDAIGTRWSIDTEVELPESVRDRVSSLVERFDRDWSRFRDDSLPARIRLAPGVHPLPTDAGPLLDLYDTLHELTDGAMSPCVGTSLEHLGYDAAYGLQRAPGWQPAPSWADTQRSGGTLTTRERFVLDVGAAGKGYLVDQVLAALAEVPGPVTVDGSGDLRHRADRGPVMRVALEHPRDPGLAIGVVELGDAAIAASAINRRAWGPGLHHVLDARTGRPADEVLATWVVAPSALLADALATALFFVPPERLTPRFGFGYVVLDHDLRARCSPELAGALFR